MRGSTDVGSLLESSLSPDQIYKLKGTGKGGMLTKGDVLLALGKVKNAWGSAEKLNLDIMGSSGRRLSEVCACEVWDERLMVVGEEFTKHHERFGEGEGRGPGRPGTEKVDLIWNVESDGTGETYHPTW